MGTRKRSLSGSKHPSVLTSNLDLSSTYELEQQLLLQQLCLVRKSIDHKGEKGANLEAYVRQFLRQSLPQQYGITTGFIAFPPDENQSEPVPSTQLDIIIYDALHCVPLLRLPECDVLPLEAVMAYVEVKAKLDGGGSSTTWKCAEQALAIRKHTTRWYLSNTGRVTSEIIGLLKCVSTRSYVFAFEGASGPEATMNSLSAATEELGSLAELSGLFVGGHGHFASKPDGQPEVIQLSDSKDALLSFRHAVLHHLARFPRYAPGLVDARHRRAKVDVLNKDRKPHRVRGDRELKTAYLDHYAPLAQRRILEHSRQIEDRQRKNKRRP